MFNRASALAFTGLLLSGIVLSASNAIAAQSQVERGKYLVTFGGCNDCHTPGYFSENPI